MTDFYDAARPAQAAARMAAAGRPAGRCAPPAWFAERLADRLDAMAAVTQPRCAGGGAGDAQAELSCSTGSGCAGTDAFGGFAAIGWRAMVPRRRRRVFQSPGPIYEPKASGADYWRARMHAAPAFAPATWCTTASATT